MQGDKTHKLDKNVYKTVYIFNTEIITKTMNPEVDCLSCFRV